MAKGNKTADRATSREFGNDIVELYKLNCRSNQIEESDLLFHVARERSTFYLSDGRLSNDVPEIQAFIDLSTADDIVLFRRRDSVSCTIIEKKCFAIVERAEETTVARAKSLYAERHGIDYDFPRRQMERRLTDTRKLSGIGLRVYDMTITELWTAFGSPKVWLTPSPLTLHTIDEESSDSSSSDHAINDLEDTTSDDGSSFSGPKLAGDGVSSPDCDHQEAASTVEEGPEASRGDNEVMSFQELRFEHSDGSSSNSHLQSQKRRPRPRLTINTQTPVGKKRQLSTCSKRVTNKAKRRRLGSSPDTDSSTSGESQELCSSSSSHPKSSGSEPESSGPISEISHTDQADSDSSSVSNLDSSHSPTESPKDVNFTTHSQRRPSTAAINARVRRQRPTSHLQRDILQSLSRWLKLSHQNRKATQPVSRLTQELKRHFEGI